MRLKDVTTDVIVTTLNENSEWGESVMDEFMDGIRDVKEVDYVP